MPGWYGLGIEIAAEALGARIPLVAEAGDGEAEPTVEPDGVLVGLGGQMGQAEYVDQPAHDLAPKALSAGARRSA